jgi:hypothetical protein
MDYDQLLSVVTHRRDIPKLLTALGLVGYGAEVGVKHADYSTYLLAKSELSLLYSVDFWCHPSKSETENISDYISASLKLFPYLGRSVILRLDHQTAAGLIPNGSLDFVYYDIGHDRVSVKEGIDTWWPKVKNGGLFCGHIFHKVVQENGVITSTMAPREALNEFLSEVRLEAHYTSELPGRGTNSWIVRKPIDF